MVICPRCNIEFDSGEKFCRNCGSLLLNEEGIAPGFDGSGSPEEETKRELFCPKCQEFHEIGNYCRTCGSLLMVRTVPEESDVQLSGKSVKRWAKELLKLIEEKKILEACMSRLEIQRNKVSRDVFHPMFLRYQDHLESLSSRCQEIETKLESIKKRTFEEIGLLERMLKPIQKRYEEVQSLYQLGAMTKADFSREKKIIRKEIRARERNLRKHRQIISLLPSKLEGSMVSPRMARDLLRPLPLMAVSGMVFLIAVGIYFTWQRPPQFSGPMPEEVAYFSRHFPSQGSPSLRMQSQELEKIRSLFENIRQANLQKNIDLFMSCYAHDFKGREEKRLATLETWKNFDYLDLSYDVRNQTISGDTARVSLEWLVRISRNMGGPPQDSRAVLDVTLKREKGGWKIKEIESAS